MKNKYRIFFVSSTGGYQVAAEIGRLPVMSWAYTGLLDKGKEYRTKESALEFANKYIQSLPKSEKEKYEFTIDIESFDKEVFFSYNGVL
jgi:hypothetical protein